MSKAGGGLGWKGNDYLLPFGQVIGVVKEKGTLPFGNGVHYSRVSSNCSQNSAYKNLNEPESSGLL